MVFNVSKAVIQYVYSFFPAGRLHFHKYIWKFPIQMIDSSDLQPRTVSSRNADLRNNSVNVNKQTNKRPQNTGCITAIKINNFLKLLK